MKTIDALGKQCPMPVIMAKNAIKSGEKTFVIQVDNQYAVTNLKSFGETAHYEVTSQENNGIYDVEFSAKEDVQTTAEDKATQKKWAVFVGNDIIGDGSHELGTNLIRMFFFTLTQAAELPSYILFMNGGVKLPGEDDQVQEHLKVLQEKGVEVLVCGTCLNFYQYTDPLKVGKVSNMYDILDRMMQADKVITL